MKAKKYLGQHFLTSQSALSKIISAGDIKTNGTVLEIGPGKGILTEELILSGARVIAVEKDMELIPSLCEKFAPEIKNGRIEIVQGDILDFDFSNYKLKTTCLRRVERGRQANYKLIANIPYYITGAILRKFLSAKHQPERMVLLVQKEVAERICAKDKKESILSISVKIYGTPRYIATVKRGSFNPPPKVDSAILVIENISKESLKTKRDEDKFFKILRAGFAHKRKIISKNLSMVFGKEKTAEALSSCNVPVNARAEDLTIDKWKCLMKQLVVGRN
ncbi:MAG: 16S rRNA (adenine(1518)-N(6)/adenine(1519)-N(6))-dimethyltransferase RsmA [Patescibacteria group bacterium]